MSAANWQKQIHIHPSGYEQDIMSTVVLAFYPQKTHQREDGRGVTNHSIYVNGSSYGQDPHLTLHFLMM